MTDAIAYRLELDGLPNTRRTTARAR